MVRGKGGLFVDSPAVVDILLPGNYLDDTDSLERLLRNPPRLDFTART